MRRLSLRYQLISLFLIPIILYTWIRGLWWQFIEWLDEQIRDDYTD